MTSPSPSVDSVRERITEIQQRIDKATLGPWDVDSTSSGPPSRLGLRTGNGILAWFRFDDVLDAQFIAESRTDVPALVAALTAVLDRIQQLQQIGYGSASDYDKGGLRAANEIRSAIAAGLGVTP